MIRKINHKLLLSVGITFILIFATSYESFLKGNGSFLPLLFIPVVFWSLYYGTAIGVLSGIFFSIYTFVFIYFILGNKNTVPYVLVAVVMLISVSFIVGKLSDLYKKTRAQEKKIDRALKDKRLLLRELHHRVKNNLNIMASFIYLQAESVSGDEAKKVLQETHTRILSMMDIYNELYRSDVYAHVNTGAYLQNITRIYENPNLHLFTEVEDIFLDSETAVSLGLIINELITNAIKYAFPEDTQGTISIRLVTSTEKEVELTVTDDGVGIPEDFTIDKAKSFGFSLITTLSAQVGGSLSIENNGGTRVTLRFPLQK